MPLDVIRDPHHAPLDPLLGRRITVLGYGNQGRAHALNLRDSGLDVRVGARADGRGWALAERDGLVVMPLTEAAHDADLVIMALPDEAQGAIWKQVLAPIIRPGQVIGFLHGFSVHFGQVSAGANIGMVLVAPKGPGATLRWRYERGEGIPCLLAVQQETADTTAEAFALAWANGIGCARAAIIRTTFADETETDLFGEQAVLCGGMTSLMLAAFRTLVEAGYPPELAYLECCHEVKQVADLVYAHGPSGMMQRISNTAEFGAFEAGPKLIDEAVSQRMRAILSDIRSGACAARMQQDHDAGCEWLQQQRSKLASDAIEPASAAVRSFMPFLAADKDPVSSK